MATPSPTSQYRKDGTAALSLSAAACLHSASDDTGLCTKCGKRVYEAVLLTDGAVTQRYAAAGEAFTAAQTEEHQGCTLRLLTDVIDDGTPLAPLTGGAPSPAGPGSRWTSTTTP